LSAIAPVKSFQKRPHPRSFSKGEGSHYLKNTFLTQSPFSFGEGLGMRPKKVYRYNCGQA